MEGTPAPSTRYHVNPDTGLPNQCADGATCAFGGDDFHYPNRHDAEVAWRARQLERGIIAYRNVMRAKEKDEEEAALAKLAGKTKGFSKKISWGVLRSVLVRNLSKYLVNFMGIFVAYAVASGEWLTDDWIRRLLPTVATIVLVALLGWFALKFWKGSRKAAVAVKKRRIRRTIHKGESTPSASS
jgi:hypothetical protein